MTEINKRKDMFNNNLFKFYANIGLPEMNVDKFSLVEFKTAEQIEKERINK